jgi:endogenous inhibitor of DNA gyrase (YacG/DUF329 family)
MSLHDHGDLTCPRCGTSLPEAEASGEAAPASVDDDQIRVSIECPECEAQLDLVVENALPEAIGVDIFVEDRRDN